MTRKRNRTTEITKGKRLKNELCGDVLELIFKKLNFLDLNNSKLVCSSWYSIAKRVETCYVPHKKVPSLIIPPLIYGNNFSLCDIQDKRNYNVKTKNMGFVNSDETCYEVGSSHGCFVFLNKKYEPFVLNPFTGSKLKLPKFTTGKRIFYSMNPNIFPNQESYAYVNSPLIRQQIQGKNRKQSSLRNIIAKKVIFSSDPFSGSKFFAVLLCHKQLSYCNVGDVAWTIFELRAQSDVMFHENKLYTVGSKLNFVGVWDFSGDFPVEIMRVSPKIPRGLWKKDNAYVISLSGRILVATRNVADNMNDDGNGYYRQERSDVTGYNWYVRETKYRTVSFDVFELEIQKQEWVRVNSLDGWAIFLGGNHTVTVPSDELGSLEDGAIYFTDDYWLGMSRSISCGGHDRGVFNIRDRKVKVCDGYGFCMMKPSPCWFVGNPYQVNPDERLAKKAHRYNTRDVYRS